MHKYSYSEYNVRQSGGKLADGSSWSGWIYEIYTDCPDYKFWLGTNIYRESEEWYETNSEAHQEAQNHIDAIENGER